MIFKNKRGLAPLFIILFLAGMLIVGGLFGGVSSFKINQIFESPWIIALIFFLVLFLLSGGKK